jgi:DNA-directed RNA polymerase subunit M/transcription elongation factor TFIIS
MNRFDISHPDYEEHFCEECGDVLEPDWHRKLRCVRCEEQKEHQYKRLKEDKKCLEQ